MDELDGGIQRITLPLPTRPGHVHAYPLPGDDGWTLVDTGVGLTRRRAGPPSSRRREAASRPSSSRTSTRPCRGRRRPSRADGRARLQGALDHAQCELVWGNPAWSERLLDWFRLHGTPDDVTAELVGQSSVYRPFIRYQSDPILVEAGERLDGWELIAAPGHADGQLCLLKDDVLVAADHLLGRITPPSGLAREPLRSARRLPRCSRPDDRARAERRAARPRGSDR